MREISVPGGFQGRTLKDLDARRKPTVQIVVSGTEFLSDRVGLINDGSFENGECGSGSDWTYASDNGCDWIVDLVPLGIWNYEGDYVTLIQPTHIPDTPVAGLSLSTVKSQF